MIEIKQTKDNTTPPLILTIYGKGGLGKSTLAATAPKPIFFDGEDGTKAFGIRGINIPVIHVKTWNDVREAWNAIKDDPQYETVVIDPMDEFMNMLIEDVSKGGSMSLPKWGEAKNTFRKFIRLVKNSGKHVVFVAHEQDKTNDNKLIWEPKLSANMSKELTDLSDVVGYFTLDKDGNRTLAVKPTNDFSAKDRYDAWKNGTVDVLDVTSMINKIHSAYSTEPFGDKVPEIKS